MRASPSGATSLALADSQPCSITWKNSQVKKNTYWVHMLSKSKAQLQKTSEYRQLKEACTTGTGFDTNSLSPDPWKGGWEDYDPSVTMSILLQN
ncbi:hypothetical protein E2562_005630 [Oryza meyeriana var. granulata]|uniref:Uncharacterized protein n=1 Tax=Oryza meyeriana var. granulata TaxID=110450 RepID=A0A6G1BHV3_9ORYZ|nr:hypothetical protein E2562_005630 [Oryza meyeriana var. granulata]